MSQLLPVHGLRLLAWLAFSAFGWVFLTYSELAGLQAAFETDARISHRLLSQRAVQHEAVLATLALLQPDTLPGEPEPAGQRLSSVYPQILSVQRRIPANPWTNANLQVAELASAQTRAAMLANPEITSDRGHYELVLSAQPASYALLIDVHHTVPWNEWPMPVQTSPVRVTLELEKGAAFVVQPGHIGNRCQDLSEQRYITFVQR